MVLASTLLHNWHTVQLDFVQAYPQAPISRVQFMAWPKGIRMPGIDPSTHVLKVTKNIYGGRNAGRTWNQYLVAKLTDIDFEQSKCSTQINRDEQTPRNKLFLNRRVVNY